MRRLLARLSDLDHRAMNARWGLLVAPFAWLVYRSGQRYGARRRRAAFLALGGPEAALFDKGMAEGEPLPPRRKRRKRR